MIKISLSSYDLTSAMPSILHTRLTPSFNIRAGTIIQVTTLNNNQGSYVLKINFGIAIGIKNAILHTSPTLLPESLLEKHVCAIINLPHTPKGMKGFNTILLCMPDQQGHYIPIQPDHSIPDGGSLY